MCLAELIRFIVLRNVRVEFIFNGRNHNCTSQKQKAFVWTFQLIPVHDISTKPVKFYNTNDEGKSNRN